MVDLRAAPTYAGAMLEEGHAALDSVFHALSNRTRRSMLRSLAAGEHNIGELAAPHRMSFAAASKHVRVLERAGLVRRRVQGRTRVCRLEPTLLARADEWLRFYERFWSERLSSLEEQLHAEDAVADSRPQRTRSRR
jgi:DNA-binding transcriptional ArsR family regulator